MVRAAILAVILAVASSGFAQAQQQCLSDGEARLEVATHKLVSVQQAISKAREKAKGDLLSANLCRMGEGFVYRISILGRDGRIARLLVNAANGHFPD